MPKGEKSINIKIRSLKMSQSDVRSAPVEKYDNPIQDVHAIEALKALRDKCCNNPLSIPTASPCLLCATEKDKLQMYDIYVPIYFIKGCF